MRWWRRLVLHFNTDDRTLDSLLRAILLSSCFRNQFSTLNKGWKNPLKGIQWPLKQHQQKKQKTICQFYLFFPLPQLLQNQNKLTQLLDKQNWHFLHCWRLSLKFHKIISETSAVYLFSSLKDSIHHMYTRFLKTYKWSSIYEGYVYHYISAEQLYYAFSHLMYRRHS